MLKVLGPQSNGNDNRTIFMVYLKKKKKTKNPVRHNVQILAHSQHSVSGRRRSQGLSGKYRPMFMRTTTLPVMSPREIPPRVIMQRPCNEVMTRASAAPCDSKYPMAVTCDISQTRGIIFMCSPQRLYTKEWLDPCVKYSSVFP